MSMIPMVASGPTAGKTLQKILCPDCATLFTPNDANLCLSCLRKREDITAGIPKSLIIHRCKNCERWLRPGWMHAEWESRNLLSILLSKIPMRQVSLVDAGFIWTEPHSMRIQVKLTVQKVVMGRIQLRHTFPVEFVIAGQQCEDCARSFTEHTWRAIVQVRQRVPHKKTFLYLEQLILKHGAHEHATNMAQMPDGVDFQYLERSHAAKFVDFLQSVVPCGYKTSKQLVSADIHTSTYNYKYTFLVTIVPLCRDDLVVLPPVTQVALGMPSPWALITRVSNHVYMVDPNTITTGEMNYERYNKAAFRSVMTGAALTKYVVYDVQPITVTADTAKAAPQRRRRRVTRRNKGRRMAAVSEDDDLIFTSGGADTSSVAGSAAVGLAGEGTVTSRAASAIASLASGKKFSKNMGLAMARSVASSGLVSGRSSVATTVSGGPRGKYLLVDVTIGPEDDKANTGDVMVVRSHLGHVLKPGDIALGLDVKHAVLVDDHEEDTMSMVGGKKGKSKGKGKGRKGAISRHTHKAGAGMPDVVLVRKFYEPRRTARKWKLAALPMTKPDLARPGDEAKEAAEREEFLQELEEDKLLRATINMYKDMTISGGPAPLPGSARPGAVLGADITPSAPAAAAGGSRVQFATEEDVAEEDRPDVNLEELLDGMTISPGAGGAATARPTPALTVSSGVLAAGKLEGVLRKASPSLKSSVTGGRGMKRGTDGEAREESATPAVTLAAGRLGAGAPPLPPSPGQ